MPAPAGVDYALTAIIAAHQGLLDRIKAGAGSPTLAILSASDVVLATATIVGADSAVDALTGQIVFAWSGSVVASVSGVAAYAAIRDGDAVAQVSMPAQAGSVAVSGKIVINTLTLIEGQPVSLVSLTVG